MIGHLVADDCLSKPLDKPCHDLGVLSLVREPSYGTLCQQFLGYFFDFLECAATRVRSGRSCNQSTNVRSQPLASIRLLGVSIGRCRGDVLPEPIQLGQELLNLLLDIFKFLRATTSVMQDIHPVDQYLVMPDERVHPTEGGFEGREPIGGLFCDIEEDFCAVNDSLFLC